MILLINANQGKIAQYFLARSLVTSLVIRLKGPWAIIGPGNLCYCHIGFKAKWTKYQASSNPQA